MSKPNTCVDGININRRQLLSAGLAVGLIAPFSLFASTTNQPILISAASDKQGKHWALCLQENGELISQLRLPGRAHQIIKHPKRSEIAIIGRRPGRYLAIASIYSGKEIRHLQPEKGFHFYGHALYTPDGRYLVTTENHIDSGEGYIFVRDTHNDYRIHKHFLSHGIGPHEIKLSSNLDTLVIANGGILTHPDKGRVKLNLDSMAPSLTYISLKNGKLLEQVSLSKRYHQLSIRHIDINQQDEVLIGMQYQGDKTDNVPLVASHKRGEALKPLWAPEPINYAMKHYCGSVCFDTSGKRAAISSPKGDIITFWDCGKLEYIGSVRCKDACGLASYQKNQFFISNGRGSLFQYHALNQNLKIISTRIPDSMAWDNHLLASS
jgi:uncharacterized protein